MASSFPLKTTCERRLCAPYMVCIVHLVGSSCHFSNCSGMESKIRSQKEFITELEERIRAYQEEIKKVHMYNIYMYNYT